MFAKSRASVVLASFLVSIAPAFAGTIRVPQDNPDLQNALNIAVDHTTIVISKGTYVGPFTVGNIDDLTIRAKGKVVLRANGPGDALTITNVNGLTLSKLRFRTASGDGLHLDTVTNGAILGCRGQDVEFTAFSTDSCTALRFEKCSVKRANDGMYIDGKAILVRNCKLSRVDGTLILLRGDEHVVERCKLSDAVNNGIDVGSALHIARLCLVTGNKIRGVAFGVNVGDLADWTTIVGNKIKDSLFIAIRTKSANPGTVVDGNSIKNALYGISLGASQVIVTRNTVKNCATGGIAADVGSGENLIHGNVVRGGAGPHFLLDGNANSLLENDGETLGGANVALNVFSGNTFEVFASNPIVRVPQDFATIQGAITASAPGVRVVIAAGTYDEALSIQSTQNVELVAKGNGPVRIRGGASPAVAVTDSTSVLLEGLQLSSDSAAALEIDQSTSVRVSDCRIEATGDNAAEVTQTTAARFESCSINASSVGVILHGAACSLVDCDVTSGSFGVDLLGDDMVVEGCRIHDCGSNGLQIGASGAPDTRRSLVRGCKITNVANKFARYRTSATDGLFADNRCKNSVETGVTIDTSSVEHVLLRNRLTRAGTDAIFYESARCRFDANVITRAGANGATVDSAAFDNLWTHNRISKCAANGFQLGNSTTVLIANTATQSGGNSIHDDHPESNIRLANSFH